LPIKPPAPPPPTRTAHTHLVPAGIVTDVPEVIVWRKVKVVGLNAFTAVAIVAALGAATAAAIVAALGAATAAAICAAVGTAAVIAAEFGTTAAVAAAISELAGPTPGILSIAIRKSPLR